MKRRPGRPRARLTDAQLAELGQPPYGDPLGTSAWIAQALARLAFWSAAGAAPPDVLERTRAILTAAARAVPPHVLARLDRDLKRDITTTAAVTAGPELVDAPADAPSIRHPPAR